MKVGKTPFRHANKRIVSPNTLKLNAPHPVLPINQKNIFNPFAKIQKRESSVTVFQATRNPK